MGFLYSTLLFPFFHLLLLIIRLLHGLFIRSDGILRLQSIELQVDNCKLRPCLSLTAPLGPNKFLNTNGPLQVGGVHMKLEAVAEGMNWTFRPHDEGFSGCLRNLTFNGKVMT